MKIAASIAWIANATAVIAATQPIVEPRDEVRLHREEVAPGAGDDADADADDERDEEARRACGLLRHRPRAGGDEQRHEHAERDQLAVREVDDPGQPVDHGIADRDEAVDAARSKTRDEDLEREAHVAQ